MVDSRQKALEIFGLKEDATDGQIEKKYNLLVKKHKNKVKFDGITMNDINQAYDLLTGRNEVAEEEDFRPNPIFKKFGLDEKKTRNFLHYHKWHIIISIIALIMVGSFIHGIITRVDPDFKMAVIGSFYYSDGEMIESILEEKFDDIEAASLNSALIFDDNMAFEMQQKAMILMVAEKIDLFIIDRRHYESYARQSAFLNLGPFADELGIDTESNKKLVVFDENVEEKNLYGVYVAGSSFISEMGISGDEMIACIKINSEYPEKAKNVLKVMLQTINNEEVK